MRKRTVSLALLIVAALHFAAASAAGELAGENALTAAWQLTLATLLAVWLSGDIAIRVVLGVSLVGQIVLSWVAYSSDGTALVAIAAATALLVMVSVVTKLALRGVARPQRKVTENTSQLSPWAALDEGNDPTL